MAVFVEVIVYWLIETDFTLRAVEHGRYRARQSIPMVEQNLAAFVQFFTADERFPARCVELLQKQDFYFATAGFSAVQSSRNHTAVVDNQDVAGIKVVEDVGELFVVDTAVLSVQDQ